MRLSVAVLALAILPAAAQSPPAQSQPSGVTAEWDVRANMQSLAADVRKLEPLLKHANPADWLKQGAPGTYVKQLESSQASVQYLVAATDKLAQEPEKLTTALDAYFQMERMDLLLGSLREGIRKYQSPDLANMLSAAYAANSVHRDRLRQHIRDLAGTREEELRIVNLEAQRCRGMLSQQAPAEKKPERRTSK
jgi:hypothetical protein